MAPTKKPAKIEIVKIQKYQYIGWQRDTGKLGEIIYVDLKNKHPDPSKLLIWGRRKSGQTAKGDYARFFGKVGAPVTIKFRQTGRYAMEENMVRNDAIIKAIRSGKCG